VYVRSKRGPHLLLVPSIGMTTPGHDLDCYRRLRVIPRTRDPRIRSNARDAHGNPDLVAAPTIKIPIMTTAYIVNRNWAPRHKSCRRRTGNPEGSIWPQGGSGATPRETPWLGIALGVGLLRRGYAERLRSVATAHCTAPWDAPSR